MFKITKLLKCWRPLQISTRSYPYPKSFYVDLKLQPIPFYTRLPNGLTVATEMRSSEHTCVGLFIDCGSRYENSFENGIAHFFEHLAFKSTCNRPRQVLEATMASTGARFKCFTTRQLAGYYAECFSDDITTIVEILSDCVFNNSFDCEEIERQKEIVYQEMMSMDADYNAVLYDYLHRAAFVGTPLAQSVMGLSSNLHNFNQETIANYHSRLFDPTRTVLAAVGGVSHQQLVDLAQRYLSTLKPSKCAADDYRFTAGDIRFRDDSLKLCHIAIAFEGPALCSKDNYVMDVALMFLGGWDNSQPCDVIHASLLARACHLGGLSKAYRTFNIKYSDTALFGVHFMSDKMEVEDMIAFVQNQLLKMAVAITENEVSRAKHEAKTRLLTKLEGVTNSCIDLGRWTLYNGHRVPLDARLHEIDLVTAEDVRLTCDHYLYDRCPAIAAVGPCEGLLPNVRIRANQYWLRI